MTSVGKDMEKLGTSHTADGNVKWWSCFKTVWQSVKRISLNTAIPFLGVCLRELKAYVHPKTHT